jgi:hypothetical protein
MANVAKVWQEPVELDMRLVVDDDITWTAFFEEELSPGVFTPMTLTGLQIQGMIKAKEKDDTVLDTWTLQPDFPAVGYLTMSLNDTQTKNLGVVTVWTSIRITRAGYTRTYLAGKIALTRRATYD